jgi:hypothetical protein
VQRVLNIGIGIPLGFGQTAKRKIWECEWNQMWPNKKKGEHSLNG